MTYRILDVAKQAGVSKSTVSRVLNDSNLVDPYTRRKVLQAAKALSYYPNASAQRLARGRSDFLGLLISDIENPVFPEMIKSFGNSAAAKGYDILLCTTNYDPQRMRAAVRRLIENSVRGVAIMTSSATEEIAQELAARQIATVVIDLEAKRRYIGSVTVDYCGGVSQGIEHLAQLGHERIAFIAGPDERRSARRYRETVLKVASERGMSLEQIIESNQTLEGGRDAVRKIWHSGQTPTALICINDLTAIGAITALQEMGINVPRDVSVLGCEDIFMARLISPPLTTVKLDRTNLGKMAFDVLEKLSQGKPQRGVHSVLQTQLIVRSSTAVRA